MVEVYFGKFLGADCVQEKEGLFVYLNRTLKHWDSNFESDM